MGLRYRRGVMSSREEKGRCDQNDCSGGNEDERCGVRTCGLLRPGWSRCDLGWRFGKLRGRRGSGFQDQTHRRNAGSNLAGRDFARRNVAGRNSGGRDNARRNNSWWNSGGRNGPRWNSGCRSFLRWARTCRSRARNNRARRNRDRWNLAGGVGRSLRGVRTRDVQNYRRVLAPRRCARTLLGG